MISPARSTILAKPAVVNGAPPSDVNTNGLLGFCSRCKRRKARISSPMMGCVAGVPRFLPVFVGAAAKTALAVNSYGAAHSVIANPPYNPT
jgi:hypothetical protein